MGLDRQRQHRTERPAYLQDRHRKNDFAAVKPVGRHLGGYQRHDRCADAADEAGNESPREIFGSAQHDAGKRHQQQADKAERLVPKTLAQHSRRKRDNDARQQISAQQHADLGIIHCQILHQHACGGSDRLKLKSGRRSYCEQDREDHPSLAGHRTPPRSILVFAVACQTCAEEFGKFRKFFLGNLVNREAKLHDRQIDQVTGKLSSP